MLKLKFPLKMVMKGKKIYLEVKDKPLHDQILAFDKEVPQSGVFWKKAKTSFNREIARLWRLEVVPTRQFGRARGKNTANKKMSWSDHIAAFQESINDDTSLGMQSKIDTLQANIDLMAEKELPANATPRKSFSAKDLRDIQSKVINALTFHTKKK